MALAGVEAVDENALERAGELARLFGVPLLGSASHAIGGSSAAGAAGGVKLLVTNTGLALGFMEKGRGKPYFVDFLTAGWRARFHSPLAASHIFRRALGVRDESVSIVDATTGLGQDAVLALSLGCSVTAVERSPVLAALLRDGVDRAVDEDEFMRARLSPLELIEADSIQYLSTLAPAKAPDVIYLDPMFEKPKKSAKSPKEMQILQELLGPQAPAEEERLFSAAISVARKRVVVKRPLKARALKATPTHSYKGQSIRYDVYSK